MVPRVERFPGATAWRKRRLGRATGVLDRAQRSAMAYDDRGNVIWSARQMAVIADAGSTLATLSGNPPLIDADDTVSGGSYDTAHTYAREARFDHASRSRSMVLPVDPDYGTSPPNIGGTLTYNARSLSNRASRRRTPSSKASTEGSETSASIPTGFRRSMPRVWSSAPGNTTTTTAGPTAPLAASACPLCQQPPTRVKMLPTERLQTETDRKPISRHFDHGPGATTALLSASVTRFTGRIWKV